MSINVSSTSGAFLSKAKESSSASANFLSSPVNPQYLLTER